MRLAQRRVERDEEVERDRLRWAPTLAGAWCSTITYGNDIRHRLSNRIVTADSARASDADLGVVEREHVRHAALGRDVDLVRVAGEVGDERDRVFVLVQDARGRRLCSARMMSSNSPRPVSAEVARRRRQLGLHRLPDEAGRVDLPVRVRVRHADDLALVLEAEHVFDARLAPPRSRVSRRQTPMTSAIAAGGISASVRSWRGEKQTTRARPAAGATRYGAGGAAGARGAAAPTQGWSLSNTNVLS